MEGIISKNVIIASGKFDKEKQYWLSKLSGELTLSRFHFHITGAGPEKSRDRMENLGFCLPGDIYRQFNRMSNQSEIGLFIILITGVVYLLARYSGNDDVIIGTPVFKQDVLGEYLNKYLALRSRVTGEMTFKDLLLQVKDTVVEANENMNYPLDKIVQSLDLSWGGGSADVIDGTNDANSSQLFSTLFIFNNIQDERDVNGCECDIVFSFEKTGGQLEAKIIYDWELYHPQTIVPLRNHLLRYYETISRQPQVKLSDLDILPREEKLRLLEEFNNTTVHYPGDKTISQLLEEQVAKTPAAVAAAFEGMELTYGKLNASANQLARMLRGKGVREGDIIGLLIPRSLEMVIGYIGVLKAQAAIIALDIHYPARRINAILEDSGARFLLKQGDPEYSIDGDFQGTIIDMEPGNGSEYDHTNTGSVLASDCLAIVVYTSGSTGKPKGVMLHHRGVINHAFTKIGIVGLEQRDICCHNLSVSFVASIWQVFAPLYKGARLAIYPRDLIIDGYELFKRIRRDQVSVLEVVPSLLGTYFKLVEAGIKTVDINGTRWLLLTGEKVEPAVVNRFYREYGPHVKLVNAYGQSECSDDTLHYKIPYNGGTMMVPLGAPSHNTRVYILCKYRQLQPLGVPGELYIWGDGLAMGYLNRPLLTGDRFVLNPFLPGERMFRTGDLARWLPDGNVEFLGRVDHQVKIRGHRIELGEIESQLLNHEDIAEVVVVAIDDGREEKHLCAYIVAASSSSSASAKVPDVPGIRDYLFTVLPDYMVPSYFVQLEKFLLNASGKVDRKRLPRPKSGREVGLYIAPSGEIEKKLAEIWADVLFKDSLGNRPIGMDSDFFDLGGHSLKATILAARIHKAFDVKIPVAKIFRTSTLGGQAEYIKDAAPDRFASIHLVEEKQYYRLSSAQKRLYIIRQMDPESTSYNMPIVAVMEGVLDVEKFKGIFRKLVRRHESLRTFLALIDGQPVQRIHQVLDFEIEYYEAPGPAAEIIENFVRPFDLTRAPLLRVGLIKEEERKHILTVDMHHIISDYISNEIVIRDFVTLYRGGELPRLRLRYRDYSAWQNRLNDSGEIKRQEAYWLTVFKGDIPVLNMPTDHPRPPLQGFAGEHIRFTIENRLVEKLDRLMKDAETTLYMVLLAVCTILLWKYTGQEDIVVGSPVMGRSHQDLENIIGMFVGQLAMRNYPSGGKTFKEFLGEVKTHALEAYENQEYQFDELTRRLGVQGNPSRNPLFDVVFAIFNKSIGEEEDGLAGIGDLTFRSYPYEDRTSKTDLRFGATEMSDKIKMILTYSPALFKRSTCKKMAQRFVDIVEQIADNNSVKLADIKLLHGFSSAVSSKHKDEQGDFGF